MMERFSRNNQLISQKQLNEYPVTIIGVGSIGSLVAEGLARLGVIQFTLFDHDTVEEANLSTQGYIPSDVGLPKVEASRDRILAINPDCNVTTMGKWTRRESVKPDSAVFCLVDSMATRSTIFRWWNTHLLPIFLDCRVSSESIRAFCIELGESPMSDYNDTLFNDSEGLQEGCGNRGIITTSMIASGIVCNLYKRYIMKQNYPWEILFDLRDASSDAKEFSRAKPILP